RPFVRRRLLAAEMIAREIEHAEPLDGREPRAHIGDREKSVRARHARADVAVAVGNAFVIENAARGHERLFDFVERAVIERDGHRSSRQQYQRPECFFLLFTEAGYMATTRRGAADRQADWV